MTSARNRHMSLGWMMIPGGTHRAAWINGGKPDPRIAYSEYIKSAREAEDAKLDFIFLADGPAMKSGSMVDVARNIVHANILEPLTLLSALSGVTSHIGLVATASTTYWEPYNLARQFASLDHISGGRSGWNIVTTSEPTAALNYGHVGEVPHALRYKRAQEFVDVVVGLWDSFEDGAVIRDAESGLYFDPDKVHLLNHAGEYFKVRGPLNIERPPQGRPVLFQAGASGPGRDLGAKFGELMFSTLGTLEGMLEYGRSVKAMVAEHGRSPDDVRICNGLSTIIRESEAEAEDVFAQRQAMLHPETVKLAVATDTETDIADLDIDDNFPLDRLPIDANRSKSADKVIRGWLEKENMTVRQLFERFCSARNALTIYGSPKKVADTMEEWFTAGAVDGFMLMHPLDSGMRDFSSMVLPELRRRDLFRTEYAGDTLRSHLGLQRPPHRTAT